MTFLQSINNKFLLVFVSFFIFSQDAIAQRNDVILGQILEPPHFDPTATPAEATRKIVHGNIFEGLTKINEKGQVEPALANKWRVSDDGYKYNFLLQTNVKFHNDLALKAEHIKNSLERISAPDSKNSLKTYFSIIENVEIISPQEIMISLKRPSERFLFNLGRGEAAIVHPDTVQTNAERPIGTGPYAFISYIPKSRVVLKRFENYWGTKPSIEMATYRFTVSTSEIISVLSDGDIDGMFAIGGQRLAKKFKNRKDIKILKGTSEGEILLAMNNARPPFNNKKFRRAITHAINKNEISLDQNMVFGDSIGSHFSPNNPAYIDLSDTTPYDLEKAKQLLSEMKLSPLRKLIIALPPTNYAQYIGLSVMVMLEEIGLNVEIKKVSWNEWLNDIFINKNYDMTVIAHTAPFDIDIYERDNYYFGYENTAFKKLWIEIEKEQSTTRRNTLLQDAQRMLANDNVHVYMFMLSSFGAWNQKLSGMWTNQPIATGFLSSLKWNEN